MYNLGRRVRKNPIFAPFFALEHHVLKMDSRTDQGCREQGPADLASDMDDQPAEDGRSDVTFAALQVLVVEDDPGDFALVERAIRRMATYEAQITTTGSVDAARKALRLGRFDIILVDHTLHDSTGLSLMPEKGAAALGCPAILVTGLLTSELDATALELGFSACIDKDDITPRVLEALVRQAIEAHRLRQDLAARPRADQRLRVVGSKPRDVIDLEAVLVDTLADLRTEVSIDGSRRLAVSMRLGRRTPKVVGDEGAVVATLQSRLVSWLLASPPDEPLTLRVEEDADVARVVAHGARDGLETNGKTFTLVELPLLHTGRQLS